MKVLIIGCGRTGAMTAIMLSQAGHAVTVVDLEDRAFRRLGPEFIGRTVTGNAIEPDVLRRAGAGESDVILAATTGDNRNIMCAQLARETFGVSRAIARIKDPVRAEIYEGLGLEVDCRTVTGAQAILDALFL